MSTQNITLPALGPDVLDLLEQGLAPGEAIDTALTRNGYSQYRQLTAIDHQGRTVHFSGSETLGTHNALSGEQCVAAGNMLADHAVIAAMVQAFEQGEGQLADRLLAAMHAAIAAGGEAGPVHSAALVVVGELTWPIINLRVDWADERPITELQKLWDAYHPQGRPPAGARGRDHCLLSRSPGRIQGAAYGGVYPGFTCRRFIGLGERNGNNAVAAMWCKVMAN